MENWNHKLVIENFELSKVYHPVAEERKRELETLMELEKSLELLALLEEEAAASAALIPAVPPGAIV